MPRHRTVLGLLLALGPSCGGGSTVVADGAATDATETSAASSTGASDTTDPSGSASVGTGHESSDGAWKFDVAGSTDVPAFCDSANAGIYCDDGHAIECDGVGHLVAMTQCFPDLCVPERGCVVCVDGEYHCSGPRVMACDASQDPARWVEIERCVQDSVGGEACDVVTGSCVPSQNIGNNEPTGTYYQFAEFQVGASAYLGGSDVDSFGDKIYVSEPATNELGMKVDVYQITLEDSDGDGALEPNQHPDNPDHTGPIEQRTIELVDSVPMVITSSARSELYVLEDRLFVGGQGLTEHVFGVPGSTLISAVPVIWAWNFSQIGFDDVRGVWYASNESQRRVFQYDAETDTWGIAFNFPDLTGDHMDGLEVVTDPNTGESYVYVSDMKSDFIGQYRFDRAAGWVQENLFEYDGSQGSFVEGFGFGALNHFWVTNTPTTLDAPNPSLYELGGGDLSTYTEVPAG